MNLKYLIVGTGRSGTVYMARFMTSIGIPCGHESIFTWQGWPLAKKRLTGEEPIELSWVSRSTRINGKSVEIDKWLKDEIVAESSYLAVPFLDQKCLENTKIIHLVRSPVNVINSYCNYMNYFKGKQPIDGYEHLIRQHVPELNQEMPQYDRAALFWVCWNSMIERKGAHFFHRVEDEPSNLLNFVGKTGPYFSDTTINSFASESKERFGVHKIESREIRQSFIAMAKEYGYFLLSDHLLM